MPDFAAQDPSAALVVDLGDRSYPIYIGLNLLENTALLARHIPGSTAVIVTNDSDLLEPIRIVRSELGLTVGVLNPHKNPTSKVLARHASFVRQIRQGVLAASQFPAVLNDTQGTFHKPPGW